MADWNALPSKYQGIALKGATVADVNKAIQADNAVAQQTAEMARAALAAQQSALQQLEPYKTAIPQPGTHATITGYDTVKFFRDKGDANIGSAAATLRTAGFTPEQVAQSRVLAFRSAQGTVIGAAGAETPPRPNVLESQALQIGGWLEDFTAKGQQEKGLVNTAMAGMGISLAGLATSVPIMVLQIAGRPAAAAPKVIAEAVTGIGKQIAQTVTRAATGEYVAEIAKGNALPLAYDTTTDLVIVSGLAGPAKAAATRITTFVAPRGVPELSIMKEVSTGRVKLPPEEVLAKNYADAMNEVLRKSVEPGGSPDISVPIADTPFKLVARKSPANQVIGDLLFSGTKDEIGAGGAVKESLLPIMERQGGIKAGESGLYTDPWAAIAYTRGGQNPGVLMLLTDSSKVQSGAEGLVRGATESDAFIRKAKEGLYGSSKSWRGDLETEIVAAPGTNITTPPPTADLATRVLAGRYADFFTSDGGRFVPIKIGLDKSFSPLTRSLLQEPTTWYAVKLYTLYNSLVEAGQALKHPGAVLSDISGTIKAATRIDRYLRGELGGGGRAQFPGVRDVYLEREVGAGVTQWFRSLWDQAKNRTKSEMPGVAENSKVFRDAVERNMESVYRASADALLGQFQAVAAAYNSDPRVRQKFEDAYIANLGVASKSMTSVATLGAESLSSLVSEPTLTSTVSAVTPVSAVSPVSRAITPSERPVSMREAIMPSTAAEPAMSSLSSGTASSIASLTSRGARTPVSLIESALIRETPRTPESIRTPETPRTPETVRVVTPETPYTPRPRTPVTPRTPITPRMSITPREPITPPPPPPTLIILRGRGGKKEVQLPRGAATWKQGWGWKWIPPELIGKTNVKPYTLPRGVTPKGARITGRTPAETIQLVGGGTLPTISVNLGKVNVYVAENASGIAFEGRGDLTDVGTMGSTTVGMSAPAKGHAYALETIPLESASPLPSKGVRTPVRKGVNRANLSGRRPRRTNRKPAEPVMGGIRL